MIDRVSELRKAKNVEIQSLKDSHSDHLPDGNLVENCFQLQWACFFLLVGDNCADKSSYTVLKWEILDPREEKGLCEMPRVPPFNNVQDAVT